MKLAGILVYFSLSSDMYIGHKIDTLVLILRYDACLVSDDSDDSLRRVHYHGFCRWLLKPVKQNYARFSYQHLCKFVELITETEANIANICFSENQKMEFLYTILYDFEKRNKTKYLKWMLFNVHEDKVDKHRWLMIGRVVVCGLKSSMH